MGTIQEPDPDRDWLKRSHDGAGGSPFTVEARTEMMGRLAEGIGDSRMARIGRVAIKATVWLTLTSISLALLLQLLNHLE